MSKKLYKSKFWVYSNGLIKDLKGKKKGWYDRKRSRFWFNKKRYYIHQIVAECFHPNWFPGCIIHHLDEDPSNNNIANLYVCKDKAEHNLFHLESTKKNIQKATIISALLPRSKKQKAWAQKIGYLPNSDKQKETLKRIQQENIKFKTEQQIKEVNDLFALWKEIGYPKMEIYRRLKIKFNCCENTIRKILK